MNGMNELNNQEMLGYLLKQEMQRQFMQKLQF